MSYRTVSNTIFTKARIGLTLWYVFIISCVCITLSSIFTFQSLRVLRFEYQRLNQCIQQDFRQQGPPARGPQESQLERITESDYRQARSLIISQVISVNLLVIVVTSIASFFLSGETLRPIGAALDRQRMFINDAAHELKTPLTALKTRIELDQLKSSAKTENKTKTSADAKTTSSQHKTYLSYLDKVQQLIDNLLILAEVTEASISLQPTPLSELVESAIDIVRHNADAKNITLVNSIDKQQPVIIQANPDLIRQLLVILLDNAIKYSRIDSEEKTTITISAKTTLGQTQIAVKDQGIGISRQHQKYIFERFYRVDSSRTKLLSSTTGHGLGLAIALQIAKLHSGTIKVISEENQGATFVVTLPR